MRLFTISLIALGCMLAANRVHAQFSISKVTPKQADTKAVNDSIKKRSSIDNRFFSESRYLAEKKRLRKERNTINLNASLNLNQVGFVNWAAGGDNTFSGTAAFSFSHSYNNGSKFTFNYSLNTRYGLQVIDGVTFKNEDLLIFNMSTSWSINKNWSYSASANFQSQFTKGYKSRTEEILVSDFMAPGTLTPAVGITYRHQKIALAIQVMPVAGNMTFVLNDELNAQSAYGVPAGKKQLSTVGSALQIDFSRNFVKDKLSYVTYFRAYTNYKENTNGIWNNTINYQIVKMLKLSAFCSMKYEELAVTPTGNKLQLNYNLGIGLAYTFSNK